MGGVVVVVVVVVVGGGGRYSLTNLLVLVDLLANVEDLPEEEFALRRG